jgi:hypothetical protein
MKLADAGNDLLARTTELLEGSEYNAHMLERVCRMKEELVTPSVRALKARPQFAASADAPAALFGAVVPPRDLIGTQVGISLIEQTVKSQRPYADKVRPRDSRGEPGGLILIEGGRAAETGERKLRTEG